MLAIDLGGTRVKVGLVDGAVVSDLVVRDHGAETLDQALASVAEVLNDFEHQRVAGLSVPGLVDDDGVVIALPGKFDGAVGFDLRRWLAQYADTAFVVNDAIAYGVGEAGSTAGRTVVLTIGTGVGCCVVEDGRPLGKGPLGGGLLGGQLPLTQDGPVDTSGRAGTVEAWCRASRIVDEVVAAGGHASDVPECFGLFAEGDVAAGAGIAAYQQWLARGVAAVCLAYGPARVVIGGGPVVPDGPLLVGLQELVDPLLWSGQRVEVGASRHGDVAALVGLEVLSA